MATEVELLSRQVELMERMNTLLVEQTEKMNTLSGAMGGQSQVAQQATTVIEEHGEAMEKMGGSAESAGTKVGGFGEMFSSVADKMKSFLGDGIFDSFSKGINMLGINFGSLADIVSNPVAAAMGFLGSIWDTLMKKAAEVYQEMLRLATAMERIREKFGSFNENTSRRTREAFENLGSTIRTTRENAAAFGSKFAPGFEGAEQRLNKVLEIATDLSPVIDLLGQQFNDAADQMYLLKDGLAFSGEALQQTAVLSQLAGKSLRGFSEEIMATINKIGKNFGVSTKVLGADVGKALTNFKMLGRMTGDYVKEITKAAVFTRKLGIELNELAGLVDKFDEFEGGAEAAAQLAQGFGMVVDPLKMMGMEVGPRLQELQRAFMATGRSIESMSRQERKLLAETAGLTEQQALLAFSSKGMSMSYDEIASGAESATKGQKTMDQIMNEVLDNIPNIIVGFKAATGFIEAFMEGVMTGFGKELLPTLTYLAKKLGEVFSIGMKVGSLLFDTIFPKDPKTQTRPLLEAIKGIADMFVTIADSIRYLFDDSLDPQLDMSEKIAVAMGRIVEAIQGAFGKLFDSISIGDIFAKAIKFMADLASGFVKWLAGPNGLSSISKSLRGAFKRKEEGAEGGGISGSLLDGLGQALETLKTELPKLGPQLLDFGGALMEMLFDFFTNFDVAGLFVAGGPILAILGDIVSNFFTTLGTLFGGGGGAAAGATAAAGAAGSKMQMGVGEGIAQAASTVIEGGKGFFEKLGDILADSVKIGAIALGIGIAIKTIGGAIHDTMLIFLEPQDGRDKSFMQIMADASKSFAELDPGTIAAAGAILASVLLAIVGVVGGLAYAANSLTSVGLELFLKLLGTAAIAGGLIYFVKRMGEGIAEMLVTIVKNFGSAEFTDSIKKMQGIDFKPLATIAGSISELINVFVGLMNVIDVTGFSVTLADTEDFVALSAQIRDMLMGVDGENGVIANIAGISIDTDMGSKFFTLSTTMPKMAEAFTSIGTIVTTLASLPDLDTAKEKSKGLHGVLFHIETLGNRIATFFPTVEAGAVTSVNNLKDAIVGVSSIISTAAAIEQLDAARENLLQLTGVTGGKAGIMSILGTLAEWMQHSFGPTRVISDDIKNNVTNMRDSVNLIGEMSTSLEKIGNFADAVENVTNRLTEAKMAEFEGTLTRIVEHVGMINSALKGLDQVRIDTTIDRLGSNMRVANKTIELAGGRVQVNVQLNLTVNTEKIASALVLGGFVSPTPDYKNEMQADYNDGTFNGLQQTTLDDLASKGASQFTYPPTSPA